MYYLIVVFDDLVGQFCVLLERACHVDHVLSNVFLFLLLCFHHTINVALKSTGYVVKMMEGEAM